jgi:hypothetical protein
MTARQRAGSEGVPANERLEPVVDPQERCGGWWTTAWHRWVSWWWRGSTIYDTALPDGYALQRTELWRARWGANTRPEGDERPAGP